MFGVISMAELWALLHFIMPEFFDSHEEFNEWFSKDIQGHAEGGGNMTQAQLSRLHMILKPFMLRRVKRDVEDEMPPKIEVEVDCPLSIRQGQLYRSLQSKVRKVNDLSREESLMNLVMQFRKVLSTLHLFF
jgi:DNA helicase INO80